MSLFNIFGSTDSSHPVHRDMQPKLQPVSKKNTTTQDNTQKIAKFCKLVQEHCTPCALLTRAKNACKAKVLPTSNPPGWEESRNKALKKKNQYHDLINKTVKDLETVSKEIDALEYRPQPEKYTLPKYNQINNLRSELASLNDQLASLQSELTTVKTSSKKTMNAKQLGDLNENIGTLKRLIEKRELQIILMERTNNFYSKLQDVLTEIKFLDKERKCKLLGRISNFTGVVDLIVPGASALLGASVTAVSTLFQVKNAKDLPAKIGKQARINAACTVVSTLVCGTMAYYLMPTVKHIGWSALNYAVNGTSQQSNI